MCVFPYGVFDAFLMFFLRMETCQGTNIRGHTNDHEISDAQQLQFQRGQTKAANPQKLDVAETFLMTFMNFNHGQ